MARIFDDFADIERAVSGTLRRAFRNAGQICISINRAYVHEDAYWHFVEALSAGAQRLIVADGGYFRFVERTVILDTEMIDNTIIYPL